MEQVKCSECGKVISLFTEPCHHCGSQIPPNIKSIVGEQSKPVNSTCFVDSSIITKARNRKQIILISTAVVIIVVFAVYLSGIKALLINGELTIVQSVIGMTIYDNEAAVGVLTGTIDYRTRKAVGEGTLIYTNGDKYIGNFNGGKMDGQGTYTWAKGYRYVGLFKLNDMVGPGECLLK